MKNVSVEKSGVSRRLNGSATFSAICRFVGFDVLTGRSTVMIHNGACTLAPVTVSISYDDTTRIIDFAKGGKHARFVRGTRRVVVVDRWIVAAIVERGSLSFNN